MRVNTTRRPQAVETFPYWSLETDELLTRLQTTRQGLNADDAAQRLQKFGANTLETKNRQSPLLLFIRQFQSPIMLILLFAVVISGIVRDWADALIILAIVLISSLLSFIQEYNAGSAAEKLKAQVTHQSVVLRDGAEINLPADQIVPGDVVLLKAGSLIPADGVVLEARDFFVNQAVLTGETFPVEKLPGRAPGSASLAARENCVFMGSNVQSGNAVIVVATTGLRTFFGETAQRLVQPAPATQFEQGIRRLGYLLTEVMLVLVIGIFAVNVFFHKPIIDSLLFSIALAVGLTPQLLPAIININLSKGSQVMARQGVIVKRLASIENLGSMDVLCTDKTGTLTEGVVQLDHVYDPAGNPSVLVEELAWLNASFQSGLPNPLDPAILRAITAPDHPGEKVDEIPYDFVRKRLSVVVHRTTDTVLVCKGALQPVLSVCASEEIDGQNQPLTPERLDEIQTQFQQWSRQGFRVLGIAHRTVENRHGYTVKDEEDLVFSGFLLFFDPPKQGVKENVEHLRQLGVQLKVITGDNEFAARHIAEMLGIDTPQIITSSQLDETSDDALAVVARNTNIFADVNPNEKERIILALRRSGHVVGYLGDGINDAPSLHSADIGISVQNAVDVAKEAADMVLLEQNLSVLEQGIREGRRTFANTLKYVFMAISANFGNMFSVAGASFFLAWLPLLPKQILMINFLTDIPQMTIASDRVDDEMILQPHRWNVGFIRRFMLIFGGLSSVFDYLTFAVLLLVFKAGEAEFQTGWFIESVLSAMLVVFVVRTRQAFLQSKPGKLMLLITLLMVLVVLILPYTPLAAWLGFTPLPARFLFFLIAIVVLYLLSAEAVKRWFYRRAANRL